MYTVVGVLYAKLRWIFRASFLGSTLWCFFQFLCHVQHMCLFVRDSTDIPLLVHYIVVRFNVSVCLIQVHKYILQSKTMFLNIHFRLKMFRSKCVSVHLMNICGFRRLRVSQNLWILSFLLACCCIRVLNF